MTMTNSGKALNSREQKGPMISIQFKTTVMSGMRWVGLFLLLTYGTASMAHAARPLPATVDNLMDLSGIKEQYSDMPEDVTAGLMEQRESFEMLTDADFGSLTSKVVTIFQPERILEAIRREIVNTLTEDEIKQLLEWYRSDLGRKITNLEIQASTRESHRKMLALKELQLTKTDRVAFARRFDELLDLSSFAVE